ncbi:MAG TPA: AEC family transporter [Casimicrobiaceae bacterium]|nr:AEC family transporter [Casimicrobiaceae bacterium]
MLQRILLDIVLPVFAVVLLGYGYAKRVKPDMTYVNRISLNVLSPALIFSALTSRDFEVGEHVLLMIGTVAVVLGSGLVAWPVARALRVDPKTFVPPMMFNNCGNMGLPLAMLAFGAAGFPQMVAMFAISNLLQFTLGVWLVNHHARFIHLLRNPMVWSTVIGFACALLRPSLPQWLVTSIKLVGDALIPMMLLSLGVRLSDVRWSEWRLGAIGAIVRPLSGVAIALLIAPLLGLTTTQKGLLVLFGGLPPAVLNFMVAEQFRQEPAKVASIVLIGNAAAIAFVPLALRIALR